MNELLKNISDDELAEITGGKMGWAEWLYDLSNEIENGMSYYD